MAKKKAKTSKAKKSKAKTKKKTVVKKSSAKKKATSKVSVSAKSVNKLAKTVKKARTKSDIVSVLAEASGLQKKEIASVFDNLAQLIEFDIGKKGPGVFSVPGLMKVVKIQKPATKARKGINPFTKEPMTFKAKPARNIVRVRALKGLKSMV